MVMRLDRTRTTRGIDTLSSGHEDPTPTQTATVKVGIAGTMQTLDVVPTFEIPGEPNFGFYLIRTRPEGNILGGFGAPKTLDAHALEYWTATYFTSDGTYFGKPIFTGTPTTWARIQGRIDPLIPITDNSGRPLGTARLSETPGMLGIAGAVWEIRDLDATFRGATLLPELPKSARNDQLTKAADHFDDCYHRRH